MKTFLNLPTELLSRTLSYLPVVDLCTAQWTCHRINSIITDSAYFQYIICAHINGVEDLLPSGCSFHDRLELLQHYKKSWSILQLNKSADFPISVEAPIPHANMYTLQDGYLIYKVPEGGTWRYGYIDLCSAIGNKEVSWVHIPMKHSDMRHLELTFAVDQDLVISYSVSRIDGSLPSFMIAFFEFTTGAPHPLSQMHTVPFPPVHPIGVHPIGIEILGDYILVMNSPSPYPIYLYIMSWKTGDLTHLRTVKTRDKVYKPLAIDPDNDLVALASCNSNSLEICKLEITSLAPCLQTVCSLELPPMGSNIIRAVIAEENEWVPTSKHQVYSQSSRRRFVPFRSSTIRTALFTLIYYSFPQIRYSMIVNIAALLSTMRSNCDNRMICRQDQQVLSG